MFPVNVTISGPVHIHTGLAQEQLNQILAKLGEIKQGEATIMATQEQFQAKIDQITAIRPHRRLRHSRSPPIWRI